MLIPFIQIYPRVLFLLFYLSNLGVLKAEHSSWQTHLARGMELRSDVSLKPDVRFTLAETEYKAALVKLEKEITHTSANISEVRKFFNELESLLRTVGKHRELVEIIKKRLSILEHLTGPENMLIATTMFNLATAFEKIEHKQAAIQYYKKAFQVYTAIGRLESARAMQKRIQQLNVRTMPIKKNDSFSKTTKIQGSKKKSKTYKPLEVKKKVPPYDRFKLPPQIVQEAVLFGKTKNYKIAEFGSVDLGINRIALKKAGSYIRVITPFYHVALMSKYYTDKEQNYSDKEIQKTLSRALEIKVVLSLNKSAVEENMSAWLKSTGISLNLSDNKMEASYCDDKTGQCTRAIAYAVFQEQIKKLNMFTVVLKSASLGTETIQIDMNKVR